MLPPGFVVMSLSLALTCENWESSSLPLLHTSPPSCSWRSQFARQYGRWLLLWSPCNPDEHIIIIIISISMRCRCSRFHTFPAQEAASSLPDGRHLPKTLQRLAQRCPRQWLRHGEGSSWWEDLCSRYPGARCSRCPGGSQTGGLQRYR